MGEKICHLKPVTRKKKINAANFFMQGMFQEVPYNQKVFQDCDVCDMWFHFHCVDISDEKKKQMKMILGFVVAINLPSKLLVKWQGLLRFIYIGLGYN